MNLQDILEQSEDLENEVQLSEEEINESMDFLYNVLPTITDDIYSVSEESLLALSEGQNIDIAASLLRNKKAFKKSIKAAKKAIKAGNSSEAKKNLKDAKQAINDFEKDINKFDTSKVGSQVLGFLFGGITYFINNLKTILPLFGVSFVGGALSGNGLAKAIFTDGQKGLGQMKAGDAIIKTANVVSQIKTIIDRILRLYSNIKKNKDLTPSIININYNECVKTLNEMKKLIDKMSASIK